MRHQIRTTQRPQQHHRRRGKLSPPEQERQNQVDKVLDKLSVKLAKSNDANVIRDIKSAGEHYVTSGTYDPTSAGKTIRSLTNGMSTKVGKIALSQEFAFVVFGESHLPRLT